MDYDRPTSRSPRHRVVLVAAALALALTAPAAHANFPQSVTGSVPANGNLQVTSSTLPANAREAVITAVPAGAVEETLFNNVAKILSAGRTRGRRVLTCVALYAVAAGDLDEKISFAGSNQGLALLFLQGCIRVALALSNPGTGRAAAAAATCPRSDVGAPVKVTRSGRTYRLRLSGKLRKAKGPVAVSCKRKGRGIQIKLRTRSRKQTLRKLIGTKLGIGYVNPSTGSSVRIKTTFAVP